MVVVGADLEKQWVAGNVGDGDGGAAGGNVGDDVENDAGNHVRDATSDIAGDHVGDDTGGAGADVGDGVVDIGFCWDKAPPVARAPPCYAQWFCWLWQF